MGSDAKALFYKKATLIDQLIEKEYSLKALMGIQSLKRFQASHPADAAAIKQKGEELLEFLKKTKVTIRGRAADFSDLKGQGPNAEAHKAFGSSVIKLERDASVFGAKAKVDTPKKAFRGKAGSIEDAIAKHRFVI